MAEPLHELFLNCIIKSTLSEIYSFLMKKRALNVMHIRDSKGLTVLHILALNNKTQTAEFLFRFCKDQQGYKFDTEVSRWINDTSNQDQESCIHIAISRGNLDLVKLFKQFGGDLEKVNRKGLGPMHIAAQSDQIIILAYLHNSLIPAETKDFEGNTPLHLAALYCCELATAVLLSWKIAVNTYNNKKETPLHLAVFSGSPRIVRNLLIRGIKPESTNLDGKTALDLACEKGDKEITSLIKPPGLLSLCGIKPPQRPIRFRRALMSLYVFLLGTGLVSLYYILEIRDFFYWVLAVLEIVFMAAACLKNPGYLKKNHEHKLLEISLEVECFQICPECVAKRPPRSRHCQCCNKCVEKFDHHCPWINNCIGGRNLGLFYSFLIITLFFLGYTAYICIFSLLGQVDEGIKDWLRLGITIVLTVVPVCFLFPLTLLVWVQTKNFLSNTTTNERYTRRVEASVVERTDSDNQVDRSNVLKNIWEMCCNSFKQEYKLRNNRQGQTDKVSRYSYITKEYELTQNLVDND